MINHEPSHYRTFDNWNGYALGVGILSFSFADNSFSGFTNIQLNTCYITSLLGTVSGLTAAILLDRPSFTRLIINRKFLLFVALAESLFTLAIPFASPSMFAIGVIGFFTGVFSSAFPLAWGIVCAETKMTEIMKIIPIAVGSSAAMVIILHYVPFIASLAVIAITPFICVGLLPFEKNEKPPARIRYIHAAKAVKSLITLLVSIAAYGLALGCFRGLLSEGVSSSPQIGSTLFFLGIICGSLLSYCIQHAGKINANASTIYKITLPIVTGALLSLFLFDNQSLWLTAFLVGVGFACFDVGSWILISFVCTRTRMSPIMAFALLTCTMRLGILGGALLGTRASNGIFDPTTVIVIVVFVLVAAVSLSFGRSNILEPSIGQEQTQNITATASERTDKSNSSNARIESESSQLADRFGLTPRETEVLAYLIAGRNRAYIEQTLLLSESTVKTHIRHIYEKLGVHTQQELLDLFGK